jgi:hypothetical protein
MKIKKGLKQFIKEKMKFINLNDSRNLELCEENISQESLNIFDFWKVLILRRHYNKKNKIKSPSLNIPELKPGLLVETKAGERFIITYDFGRFGRGGYPLIGLNETLDSMDFSKSLYVHESRKGKFGEKSDSYEIVKVYKLKSLQPGILKILTPSESNMSIEIIWKRL